MPPPHRPPSRGVRDVSGLYRKERLNQIWLKLIHLYAEYTKTRTYNFISKKITKYVAKWFPQ